MVTADEFAEEEVPIPDEEEEGRVAELLTPHFPYIPEGLLPSIFDNGDGPSLEFKHGKIRIVKISENKNRKLFIRLTYISFLSLGDLSISFLTSYNLT